MSNISQKQTTYLFVDGSNFRQYFNETTQKWFGQEVEFDFGKIKDFFKAEKAFYYDCINDIKNDQETDEEFEERVNEQEEKLNEICEVEGCHVFLGSLRRAKKQKKRGQKEVDVMLAVQMMEHAFRGNMNKAVLLSGDLDFRPLVESLVRLGLFIEVVGDQNHISQKLIHSADSHKKLNLNDYFNWVFPEPPLFKSLPFIKSESPNFNINHQPKLIKVGVYQNQNIELKEYFNNEQGIVYAIIFGDSKYLNQTFICSKRLSDLELYFEILYGKVDWK
jgi:uncharacterized LabA/DUF88 family protein